MTSLKRILSEKWMQNEASEKIKLSPEDKKEIMESLMNMVSIFIELMNYVTLLMK
jgi:hypothetical protein